MVSTLEICSAAYRLLNIPEITNEITGAIYIGSFPAGDQKENIVLNVINNPNLYLQNGFMNLNIYARQDQSGRPPIGRFKTLIDIILPKFKDTNYENYFFQVDDDKGWFSDPDNDGNWFYNIRLAFQKH